MWQSKKWQGKNRWRGVARAATAVVAGLVILAVPGPASAKGDPDEAAIQRVVSDFARNAGYPGIAVAISKGDQVLYTGGYGKDSSAPATCRVTCARDSFTPTECRFPSPSRNGSSTVPTAWSPSPRTHSGVWFTYTAEQLLLPGGYGIAVIGNGGMGLVNEGIGALADELATLVTGGRGAHDSPGRVRSRAVTVP